MAYTREDIGYWWEQKTNITDLIHTECVRNLCMQGEVRTTEKTIKARKNIDTTNIK